MNLEDVKTFVISPTMVRDTEKALQYAGREGNELFVLWSGVAEGERFVGRTVHVPRQTSYRLETGLCVRVEGEALHKLNTWLYEHGEILAVQVHAHPTDAFHSDTDDTYPIVTMRGGLSIVAATFCRHGLLTRHTAYFRLLDGEWKEQSSSVVAVS